MSPAPRSQVLPGTSLLWVLNYIYYDNEAAGSIYTKLWGFHLPPCHWYRTSLYCTSKTSPSEGVDLQVDTSGAGSCCFLSHWEKRKAHLPLISDLLEHKIRVGPRIEFWLQSQLLMFMIEQWLNMIEQCPFKRRRKKQTKSRSSQSLG